MYLKNYSILNGTAYGDIYDDEKGRFDNGTFVRTSRILDQFEMEGKKYIQTKNSIYELREAMVVE